MRARGAAAACRSTGSIRTRSRQGNVRAWPATTRRRAVLMNKPKGVVTTRQDPEGRPTVYSLLEDDEAAATLVPIGPLDAAGTGLLLLTSDSALAASLNDPANAVTRTYVVTVRGYV